MGLAVLVDGGPSAVVTKGAVTPDAEAIVAPVPVAKRVAVPTTAGREVVVAAYVVFTCTKYVPVVGNEILPTVTVTLPVGVDAKRVAISVLVPVPGPTTVTAVPVSRNVPVAGDIPGPDGP